MFVTVGLAEGIIDDSGLFRIAFFLGGVGQNFSTSSLQMATSIMNKGLSSQEQAHHQRGVESPVDPLGQPIVMADRDYCFRTFVRPYVRPHFSNLAKQNKDINVHYWQDCGSGRVDH